MPDSHVTMIGRMITIVLIPPHLYATASNHVDSTAIAAPIKHVRMLGIEIACVARLSALRSKNPSATAPRTARRQVGLQHLSASPCVVERATTRTTSSPIATQP